MPAPSTTPASISGRWTPFLQGRAFRILILVPLLASVLAAIVGTIHWPIVGDAPLLHYGVFLHDHGLAVYREIIDMNMPGTYALEGAAIHLLGPGPLAWRIFDFLLLAVIGASMVVFAGPRNRTASLFAATLFALIHFRDGPPHSGQRDLMATAFLLPGCAALCMVLREPALRRLRQSSALLLAFFAGLCFGAASTIKPSNLSFAAVFTTILWLELRRRRTPAVPAVLATVAGILLPLAAALVWLERQGSLLAVFHILRGLDLYHASLGRPSLPALIVGSFPSVLLAVAIPALPIFVLTRPWRDWRGQLLIAGVLLGAFSYILQGKGFPYHRYPTEAFLLLLIACVAFSALDAPADRADTSWPRVAAVLCILLGAFFLGPVSAAIACHYDWRNQEFNQELAADLTALSPAPSHTTAALQREVQCLDNTAGCANTLYNLQIVQATGFLYDCYGLQTRPSPLQDRYREAFLDALTSARPRILVLSNQDCFTMNRTFSIIDRWPDLRQLLDTRYTLVTERTPPHTVGWWRHPSPPFSYRIYLRKPE